MTRKSRTFRVPARALVSAALLCGAFMVPAAAAHADLPLPTVTLSPIAVPLPTSSPLPLPSIPIVDQVLPSVTSSPLPGQLNDTVKSLTDLLGLSGSSPSQGPNGGSNGSGASGTSTGTSSSTNATGQTGTVLDGMTPLTIGSGASALSSGYAAIAGRGAAKAAGRILHLAGPLAPPLVLAGLVLGILYMLGHGSQRLVKLDPVGVTKRRWRL